MTTTIVTQSTGVPNMAAPTVQYSTNQQPQLVLATTTTTVSRRPGVKEGHPAKVANVFGVLTIITGALSILLNIIALTIGASAAEAGHGFWGGILFLIVGILTVASARTKSTCVIIGMLVMSIIAAIISVGFITAASVGLGMDNHPNRFDYSVYGSHIYTSKHEGKVAVNALLLTCSLIGGFLCLAISIVACVGLCSSSYKGGVVLQPGQQVFINGQSAVIMPQAAVINPQQQQPQQQGIYPIAYGAGAVGFAGAETKPPPYSMAPTAGPPGGYEPPPYNTPAGGYLDPSAPMPPEPK